MKLQDYDTSMRYQARVLSNDRLTPPGSEEVRELLLEVKDPRFHGALGRNVGLLVPGPHAFGNPWHFRLYTIADLPASRTPPATHMVLCVKRCDYIDEYSGERYYGVASNYLCNRTPGDQITLSGPYGLAFPVPEDRHADLLLIGMGTGIAPFRALLKHIYHNVGDWRGRVRLFYGARTGLELLYMNDERNDLTQYFDQETFKAIHALSPRPHRDEPAALDSALSAHQQEVWDILRQPNSYVYIAGLDVIRVMLDKTFADMAGGEDAWHQRKAALTATRRWMELIY